jgi:hypothetical protein
MSSADQKVSGIELLKTQTRRLSKVRRSDLNDSRSSDSVVVRDGGSIGLEDSVDLTSGASVANGDSGVDHVVLDNCGREHGTVSKREGDVERAGGDSASRGEVKGDGLALHDGTSLALAHAEGRESLDGKRRVRGRASLDERRCQGVDLVEVEGDVERLGEGRGLEGTTEECIVASLDSEDATSSGNVGRVGDEGCSTEVGAHANSLDDVRRCKESIGCKVAKVVCALSDRCDTSSLKCGGQEVNVDLLITTDLLEVLVEVGAVEARGGEVCSRELLEGLAVEGGLEVLKSQCVVEDDTVDISGTLDESRCSRGSSGQDDSAND